MKLKLLSLAAAALSVALIGCGPSSSGGGQPTGSASGEKVTVALLPKAKGSPYFTSCSEGAQEAAAELGIELIYDGPTDGSAEKAAQMVDRWALQGVDVIAVSASDPSVLGPAMKAAQEKGIKVITWDADTSADSRAFMVNQATAQDIGFGLADTMAKDLGGDGASGDVAIITADLTAANQNAWIDAIKERLAKYPGLKLVATKPAKEDQKLAFSVAQDLMKAYPNLKGIFAISSVSFPAAAEAIKQSGKAGQVMVTGLATPDSMRQYVKDGVVKSVVLWNTKDLGYLTIAAANALAKGDLKSGSTELAAGRLGSRKVQGDQVMLGEMLIFTKENIDQYKF